MAFLIPNHSLILGLILPIFASAQESTDSYMQYMLDRHVKAVEFKDFNQASAYLGTREEVTELATATTKPLNFEITEEECELPNLRRSQLSQCISAQVEIESAIVEQNPWNYNSGFERQYGRTLINLKGQYVKPIQNSRIQGFSIEFDVVPKDMVMDYRENPSSNNINRYKNTG